MYEFGDSQKSATRQTDVDGWVGVFDAPDGRCIAFKTPREKSSSNVQYLAPGKISGFRVILRTFREKNITGFSRVTMLPWK